MTSATRQLETAPTLDEPSSVIRDSQRNILRATLAAGGASVISLFLAALRTKVIAVMLGPAGVGLLGMLNNLFTIGKAANSFGLNISGTREIAAAAAAGNPYRLAVVDASLVTATRALALVGLFIFAAASLWISAWTFGEPGHGWQVAKIGVAIFFSVLGVAPDATLGGRRQIRERARLYVVSAGLATVLSIAGVLTVGIPALAALFVVGAVFDWGLLSLRSAQLSSAYTPVSFASQRPVLKAMLSMGLALTAAGVVAGLGQFAVRKYLVTSAGIDEAGYFHASWSVSALYMGVLFSALNADFFPRMTAHIANPVDAAKALNGQMTLALCIIGPISLALLTATPLILEVLYSKEFLPAVAILRWQLLGNLCVGASWVIGFYFLATGNRRISLVADIGWYCGFFGMIALGFSTYGRGIVGVAYLACCIGQALSFVILVRRRGIRLEPSVIRWFAVLWLSMWIVGAAAQAGEVAAWAVGLPLTLGASALAFMKLRSSWQ